MSGCSGGTGCSGLDVLEENLFEEFKFDLTEKAANEIKKVQQEQNIGDTNVRVSVGGGGCSGFQYNLGFEESSNFAPEKDFLVDQNGVNIIIDKKSSLYLQGTVLDFVDELNGRGFKFSNPLATKNCGCGNSFNV